MLRLVVWSTLALLCSGYVDWIYPGPNLTFNYIDTVYFTWTSDIAEPWMNLWCAPSTTSPQSSVYVYHAQESTNGTSPQSFPYSEYNNNGLCHMQLEDFAGDDWGNTPTFEITSDDAVAPHTWLSGTSNPPTIASSLSTEPSIVVTVSVVTMTLPQSSSLVSSSSTTFSSSSTTVSPSATISSTDASFLTDPTTTITSAQVSPTPQSPPSNTLSAGAKAGIGIGSIFCALFLVVAVLLCRIASSRRRQNTRINNVSRVGTKLENTHNNTAEIGEGLPFCEVHGVARPSEIHGTPLAEVEWAP